LKQAVRLGLDAGVDGYSVAHKAACMYATYLEKNEKKKIAMFEEVAERCERHQAEQPDNAAAWYWHAYALGRYAQGISIVKALAQGIAPKVRNSLDKTLALAPKHADAHIALGAFHAEIIGSVGAMIGGLTYGARRKRASRRFKKALELNPDTPSRVSNTPTRWSCWTVKKKMEEAVKLYEEAAAVRSADAMERLDVERRAKNSRTNEVDCAHCVLRRQSNGASRVCRSGARDGARAGGNKIALVYGGGNVGLMGVIADEVLRRRRYRYRRDSRSSWWTSELATRA
jgi:tetratricopeptide (TPR) repeat protein